jgi:hypothetical protein
MSTESESLSTVLKFIEEYNRNVRHAYEQFIGDEYEWIENPTTFFPKGRAGGRREVLEAISFSEGTLRDETIDIKSSTVSGNTVALEAIWRAKSVKDLQGKPASIKMEARMAMFLRVKSGKIISSHEYICSAPPG